MTVNEFCGKVHLPSVVSHFGWEVPKVYKKVPMYGWYATSKSEDMTFNCIDLFTYNQPVQLRGDYDPLIRACYRYFTQVHPEVLEEPLVYSETTENKLAQDFVRKHTHDRLLRMCRYEATDGSVNYHAKNVKFTKLLADLGMSEFIHTGVGLVTNKVVNCKELDVLKLKPNYSGHIILPTYFAPNRTATIDLADLTDLGNRVTIFRNMDVGWYGKIGTNIVGGIRDLLTLQGCTWHPNVALWAGNKVLTLHQSLQPNQCIEIWTNMDNLVTDKNPISLIKSQKLEEHIKSNISKLNIHQIGELELATGQQLKKAWLGLKTSETDVAGIRFISNNDRYYYCRGKTMWEFTNFTVQLTHIKKEGGEFWQYGTVTAFGKVVPFRVKQKNFISQYKLLKAITDVMLEEGLGIPTVTPNLKNYLTNVINAFNPVNVNNIEKPAPAPAKLEDQRELSTSDEL